MQHGGDIIQASQGFAIEPKDWLDLSTGINPYSYPFTQLSSEIYRRLAYLQPDFLTAAADYYGRGNFRVGNGSQGLIQLLPNILPDLPLLVPDIGYKEWQQVWQAAQRPVHHYSAVKLDSLKQSISSQLEQNSCCHLLLINPNNPSGLLLSPEYILGLASSLGKGGYLIIDEAFIDMTPEQSLLAQDLQQWPENLIVLRSFGKFFGLAGLRLGFMFASDDILQKIEQAIGLWAVNGPAQAIAEQAFNDKAWQQEMRQQMLAMADFNQQLWQPLTEHLQLDSVIKQPLFLSWIVQKEPAEQLYQTIAEAGILVRLIDIDQQQALVRIGFISMENTAAALIIKQFINRYIDSL